MFIVEELLLVDESLPDRALMLRRSQQSHDFARGEDLSYTNDAVICYSWSRSAHLEQTLRRGKATPPPTVNSDWCDDCILHVVAHHPPPAMESPESSIWGTFEIQQNLQQNMENNNNNNNNNNKKAMKLKQSH
ncbi:hypothetical protein Ddye_001862 [Dipteronia dyeriana]|uniref:Uncharacterized protein n=1 Tax=Dipteronia dyeriana TaxID=168575 RepID=A0AAD9XQ05_9ROSI|nr:hypothetical protein Ddye_001862 [Dipteronia dyeriana]